MKTIKLTKDQVAIVDDEDFDALVGFNWQCMNTGYAGRRSGTILMHRVIMNPPPGLHVDHIDGNKLDNRRANLRLCTRAENMRNRSANKHKRRSKYKGVYWQTQNLKWFSVLQIGERKLYLGTFAEEIEAAHAYDAAAAEHFGEFARLNTPADRVQASAL